MSSFKEELIKKLEEAEKNGRFFITINVVTEQKGKDYKFDHYEISENFPQDQRTVNLNHLIGKINAKGSKIRDKFK